MLTLRHTKLFAFSRPTKWLFLLVELGHLSVNEPQF